MSAIRAGLGNVRALLVLTCCVLLTGCAGVHLHRPADEETARKAQTALEDAKLTESIIEEREVLARMLARELEIVRRQTQARRDSWLRVVIGNTDFSKDACSACSAAGEPCGWKEYFKACLVAGRANDIIDPNIEEMSRKSIIAAAVNLAGQRQKLADARERYATWKRREDPDPACPVVDRPQNAPPDVEGAFQDFARLCGQFESQRKVVEGYQGQGALGKANSEIVAFREAERMANAQIDAATKEYKEAKKRYDDAVASSKGADIEKAAKELRDKLNALTSKAEALAKISGESGLAGTVARLKLEKESIDAVIDALIDFDNGDSKAPNREVAADLLISAELIRGAVNIVNLQAKPPIAPLLLESEHLRLQLESADRRLATILTRIELLERKRDAVAAEAELLDKAAADLAAYETTSCPRSRVLMEDLTAASLACRELMVSALLRYANSWTLGRFVQEEMDYRVIGLRHLAVIDQSEVAFAQWENVLSVPIGQLVEYHSGGIRPEDVANLINALGLGAIGYGVNK